MQVSPQRTPASLKVERQLVEYSLVSLLYVICCLDIYPHPLTVELSVNLLSLTIINGYSLHEGLLVVIDTRAFRQDALANAVSKCLLGAAERQHNVGCFAENLKETIIIINRTGKSINNDYLLVRSYTEVM
eukprot:XP_001709102.1 Hypothetical protein GL50803_20782 [Giardia lamblia ATCC 50803]